MPVLRTLMLGTIAAVALATLVGCGGGSGAEQTGSPEAVPAPLPTATSTPTPEPTVADPLESVVALVARPTVLELRSADDSVVAEIDYLGAAADAVATLTGLFGTDPVDEAYPATSHAPAGVLHSWGSVTIDERQYDEAMRTEKGLQGSLVWPNLAVYFDAADNGGVALTTAQGYAAGDAWETVAAASDVTANPSECTGPAAELADDPVQPTQIAVVLAHEPGAESVLSVAAPLPFYVDGCV
ncbi:hypothetical protein [Leifsonia sp. Leaf264]|uniref:hypothetical protein n=1 Tax=Leifsonia sp. Leaf264 TaxID=1736314 RepID=UPI0012FC3E95|nr:hypothetical protein [Leifsonia sp. Leaf264]